MTKLTTFHKTENQLKHAKTTAVHMSAVEKEKNHINAETLHVDTEWSIMP